MFKCHMLNAVVSSHMTLCAFYDATTVFRSEKNETAVHIMRQCHQVPSLKKAPKGDQEVE